MMDGKVSVAAWEWPVKPEIYDRSSELETHEAATLRANPPLLKECTKPRMVVTKCELPRLLNPLEDVCNHIQLRRQDRVRLNLLRMRQEIPLSDAEVAALDDGVSAFDSLLNRLANVPTPAGPTPIEIRCDSERAAD